MSISAGCVIGNGVRLSNCVIMRGVQIKDHTKVRGCCSPTLYQNTSRVTHLGLLQIQLGRSSCTKVLFLTGP